MAANCDARLRRKAVRRKNENVTHEDKRFVSLVTEDGKRHSYLNSAVPRRRELVPSGGGIETTEPIAPMEQAICPRCGFGYSHLMRNPAGACNECRIEHAALLAKEFEDAGIPMGWNLGVAFDPSDGGFSIVRSNVAYAGACAGRSPASVHEGLYGDRGGVDGYDGHLIQGTIDNINRAYEDSR